MADHDRRRFEFYREAVYARLRRYTSVLENPDDRVIAVLARTELPRYVRYWVALLAEREPTLSGKCPTCSRCDLGSPVDFTWVMAQRDRAAPGRQDDARPNILVWRLQPHLDPARCRNHRSVTTVTGYCSWGSAGDAL